MHRLHFFNILLTEIFMLTVEGKEVQQLHFGYNLCQYRASARVDSRSDY